MGVRARGLAALLWVVVAGCGAPARPTHILLISIDSLRADHLGVYGYTRPTSPHIDALARRGALFERATSSTSWTLPAHAALMTGLPDSLHGVRHGRLALGPGLPTLAEQLRAAGFATAAVVSGPFLAPRFGLQRGFESYLNCMSFLDDDFEPRAGRALNRHLASHRDVTGPCVVRRARAWLAEQRDRRGFLFLHFWDVHYDYRPPRDYVARFDPDYAGSLDPSGFARNPAVHAGMDPRDLEHIIALYDAEIAYTDERVGEVLRALEELDMAERTLVVLTADHGDAFFEHGEKGHQKDLHREVVEIPLVLAGPGVPRGLRLPGPAHLTDVAPSVLELAGAAASEGAPARALAGRSLVPALRGADTLEDRWVLSELHTRTRRRVALESRTQKLMRDLLDGTTSAYDLVRDPGEQRPVPADAAAAQRLDALLGMLGRTAGAMPPPRRLSGPDPLARQLEALGYAAGRDSDSGRPDER